MDEHKVGQLLLQNIPNPLQHSAGDVKQRLPRPHNGKIIIRYDAEYVEHGIEHFPMLSGNTDKRAYMLSCLKLPYKRAHFDRLRSCSENQHNCFHGRHPLIP